MEASEAPILVDGLIAPGAAQLTVLVADGVVIVGTYDGVRAWKL